MLEARIYDDLYGAAVDQLARREKIGQPTSDIKAVRIEVQHRSQDYMRALFDSMDPSAGAVAADIKYYIHNLEPRSQREFIQAWGGIFAAVTLDHIEQIRKIPWQTSAFLDDINDSAYKGTPIPTFQMKDLTDAGDALGRLTNPNLPGAIWVSDKITTVLIRRGLGIKTEPQGENLTPADFFKDYKRLSRIRPVLTLLYYFEERFHEEFMIAGKKLGIVVSSLKNRP